MPRERGFIVVEEAGVGCGEGDYVLGVLFKRGIDTLGALRLVARRLGLQPGRIGVAGLKDADASTVQYVTLPLTAMVERVLAEGGWLRPAPNVVVRLLCTTRRMLRPGLLRGNRFTLVLRASPAAVERLVEAASSQPLLNYYGYQRFGVTRPNTHVVGLLLALGDPHVAHEVLYAVYPDESPAAIECRLRRWRCSLRGGKWYEAGLAAERALHRLHERLRSLLARISYSALQGYIFNLYLSKRVEEGFGPDTVLDGERAARNGYPMAPVPGRGVELRGAARRLLHQALIEHGLAPSILDALSTRGYWRPLYTRPHGIRATQAGECVVLSFSLEKGSYATLLVREIAENPLQVA